MAALPILTTKLNLPDPRKLIARARLHRQMDESLYARLTLIAAPAGYGKTTLLSGWLRSQAELVPRTAWLSLDESDNDPVRFWLYLVSALRIVIPEIGEATLSALNAPQPQAIEVLLTPLLNDLAAISTDLLLVLDDYHAIQTPRIHDEITFLVENLPSQVHLYLTTREIPPLALHRWRARNQLIEIQARDLRFTTAETAAFLQLIAGVDLSADDLALLESRTEGWVAGLQMAALSLESQTDVSTWLRSLSGDQRYIFDYLSEDIFARQSEHIQQFFMQTCILERLCAGLCSAILDQPSTVRESPQATLEAFEKANLFFLPLDDRREWYRYHLLFGETLRRRLQRAYPE